MTAAEQPAGALGDAESDAWDALWETDAARCCSCPSCNYYALDYEAHKDEPCLLQTLIERILAARLAAVPVAVDERAGGETVTEWGVRHDGTGTLQTTGEGPTAKVHAEQEMARIRHNAEHVGGTYQSMLPVVLVTRQRTRYPDDVTDWTPATPPTQERPGD